MTPTSQPSTSSPKSSLSDSPRSGIVRRGGIRTHRKNVRPVSAGNWHPEPIAHNEVKPGLYRQRSASCTNLDWLKNGLEWQNVESSEYLDRSDSYKSVSAEGPILDIRHDCVKSNSPTIVHQRKAFAAAPQSAEVMEFQPSSEIAPVEPIIETLDLATNERLPSYVKPPKAKRFSRLSIFIPTSHARSRAPRP